MILKLATKYARDTDACMEIPTTKILSKENYFSVTEDTSNPFNLLSANNTDENTV